MNVVFGPHSVRFCGQCAFNLWLWRLFQFLLFRCGTNSNRVNIHILYTFAELRASVFAWGINLNEFSKEYCANKSNVFAFLCFSICWGARAKQIIQWFFLYFVFCIKNFFFCFAFGWRNTKSVLYWTECRFNENLLRFGKPSTASVYIVRN